jgi:thiamine-phosphate pyrophosphorylase
MQLIVISDPMSVPNEADLINQMFEEGLPIFHLRKPSHSENEIDKLIKGIEPCFLPQISLHQHHQMAEKYNIRRLHFNGARRTATASSHFRKLENKPFVLSTSAHSSAEIETLDAAFDYTFYGPVFNSISKHDYPALLRQNIAACQNHPPVNLFALGGICPANVNLLVGKGYSGVAILGAIWKEGSSPIDSFRRIQRAVEKIKNKEAYA